MDQRKISKTLSLINKKLSKRLRKGLSKAAIYLFCVFIGILWQRYYGVHQLLIDVGIRTIEFSDSHARIKKEFSTLKNPLVILIAGQSNVANTVSSLSKNSPNIYNFYNNTLYHAQDPLLGATGKQGSIWIKVSEQLLKKTNYKEVVIINIARNNSSISDWIMGGKFNTLISDAVDTALFSGLRPNVFLWGQGERDAFDNMGKNNYQEMLGNLVNQAHQKITDMPIIISISSKCFSNIPSINIRQAQFETIQFFNFVFQGPDTDKLGSSYRYDDCHFNAKGREYTSRLWTKYIINTLP